MSDPTPLQGEETAIPTPQVQPSRPNASTYWVTDQLLAGEYPGDTSGDEAATAAKLAAFKEHGISCFIDLTKEDEKAPYEPVLTASATDNVAAAAEYHRVPIADAALPTPERMKDILDLIDQKTGTAANADATAEAAPGRAYLHCGAGIGRTGTVVGCFLVRHGWSGPEAAEEVKRLAQVSERSQGADGHVHLPSETQLDFIKNWKET